MLRHELHHGGESRPVPVQKPDIPRGIGGDQDELPGLVGQPVPAVFGGEHPGRFAPAVDGEHQGQARRRFPVHPGGETHEKVVVAAVGGDGVPGKEGVAVKLLPIVDPVKGAVGAVLPADGMAEQFPGDQPGQFRAGPGPAGKDSHLAGGAPLGLPQPGGLPGDGDLRRFGSLLPGEVVHSRPGLLLAAPHPEADRDIPVPFPVIAADVFHQPVAGGLVPRPEVRRGALHQGSGGKEVRAADQGPPGKGGALAVARQADHRFPAPKPALAAPEGFAAAGLEAVPGLKVDIHQQGVGKGVPAPGGGGHHQDGPPLLGGFPPAGDLRKAGQAVQAGGVLLRGADIVGPDRVIARQGGDIGIDGVAAQDVAHRIGSFRVDFMEITDVFCNRKPTTLYYQTKNDKTAP